MILVQITKKCLSFLKFTRKYSSQFNILSKELDIPLYTAKAIVDKLKMHSKNIEDLEDSINYCKKLGYTNEDIIKHAKLLKIKAMVLDQHNLVLLEGGFSRVEPFLLANFRKIFHKQISLIKLDNYMEKDVNVAQSFLSHLKPKPEKIDLTDLNDTQNFNHIHLQVMKRYLMWRLNASWEDIERLFRIYKMIKNKSMAYLCENIEMAKRLGFTEQKLLKYGYLLHNYPNYTKTVLSEMPNLAGADLSKWMRTYPKLVMVSPRNYRLIYKYLKDADISDETISKTMNIFHLSPKTVKERLDVVNSVAEFKIHLSNPKILKLIVHHNRAKNRLNFLEQVKLKCASLHLLKTDNNLAFESHIKEGKDVNLTSEVVLFIKDRMNTPTCESEYIEKNLRLHPFYLQVPLLQIERTYRHLRRLRFKKENIARAVQVLLYPVEKIDLALSKIKNDPHLSKSTISKQKQLYLILYYMEKDYHFTGNGVWISDPEVGEK